MSFRNVLKKYLANVGLYQDLALELEAIRINLHYLQNYHHAVACQQHKSDVDWRKLTKAEAHNQARAENYLEQYFSKISGTAWNELKGNDQATRELCAAAMLLAFKADDDYVEKDKSYVGFLNTCGIDIEQKGVSKAQMQILEALNYTLGITATAPELEVDYEATCLSTKPVRVDYKSKKLICLEQGFLLASQKNTIEEKKEALSAIRENKVAMKQGFFMRNMRKLSPMFACEAEKTVRAAVQSLSDESPQQGTATVFYRGAKLSC